MFTPENMTYIVFFILCFVFVILAYLFYYNFRLNKLFVNVILEITCKINIDHNTNKRYMVVSIFNRTFHNIEMSSVGCEYLYNIFDFTNDYRKYNNLNERDVMFIKQRSYVMFEVDVDCIRSKFTSSKIKKLYFFVVDSLGRESKVKAKYLRRYLIHEFKMLEVMDINMLSEKERNEKFQTLELMKQQIIKESQVKYDMKELKILRKELPVKEDVNKEEVTEVNDSELELDNDTINALLNDHDDDETKVIEEVEDIVVEEIPIEKICDDLSDVKLDIIYEDEDQKMNQKLEVQEETVVEEIPNDDIFGEYIELKEYEEAVNEENEELTEEADESIDVDIFDQFNLLD